MGSERPIGLGLIGCGGFGLFVLQAAGAMDQVRLVAAARGRTKRARDVCRSLGVSLLPGPTDVVRHPEVQLVHVATPPGLHYETVMEALEAGKHVLCEKPLATQTAQARRMIDAAKRKRRTLGVNLPLRYCPVVQAVDRILESKVLGRPLAAMLTNCAADTDLPPRHWFWQRELSGGIFIEHGVHFFDLYKHWFGAGKAVSAHAQYRQGTDQTDRVTCTIRHGEGVLASHYHGFDQIHPMDRAEHRIVTELGDVHLCGWIPTELVVDAAVDEEGAEVLRACCPEAHVQTAVRYSPQAGHTLGRGQRRDVTRRIRMEYRLPGSAEETYAGCLRALLADQIAHIRNPSHKRVVTEADGLAALRLAERATKLASPG